MRRIFLVSSLGVLALSTAQASDNQTVEREIRGEITSVYYDLRQEVSGVRGGLPPEWPHAGLSMDVTMNGYKWSKDTILANGPGSPINTKSDPLKESRISGNATFRQSLWTPFVWDAMAEFQTGLVTRSASNSSNTIAGNNSYSLKDPKMLLLLPLWQERYAGLLVGGGVALPTGNQNDWFDSGSKTGLIADVRWSFLLPGLPWTTAAISAQYQRNTGETKNLYASDPVTEATLNASHITVGARVTHRLTKSLGVSVAYLHETHRFDDVQVPGFPGAVTETILADRVEASGHIAVGDVRWTVSVGTTGDQEEPRTGITGRIAAELDPW